MAAAWRLLTHVDLQEIAESRPVAPKQLSSGRCVQYHVRTAELHGIEHGAVAAEGNGQVVFVGSEAAKNLTSGDVQTNDSPIGHHRIQGLLVSRQGNCVAASPRRRRVDRKLMPWQVGGAQQLAPARIDL